MQVHGTEVQLPYYIDDAVADVALRPGSNFTRERCPTALVFRFTGFAFVGYITYL